MMPFLMIIGAVIGFIGFILILVAAFRTSVWWGFGILAAAILPTTLLKNVYVASFIGLAVVLVFIVQHWQEARVGFIAYVVGTVLVLPGLGSIHLMGKADQPSASQTTQSAPATAPPVAPTPEPQPVTRAAALPSGPILPASTTSRTPKAESNERPAIEMKTTIEQVYVLNQTKKYYPMDCAARPDGAYKMAKSLAIGQGFSLAPECVK
jgi:hypothetical protein